LLRIRSSAGYTIDTHESKFRKRHPKGDVAVVVILAGSNNKSTYFYKRNGSIAVLRIDGKQVTKVGDVELGGLPEGAAFTPEQLPFGSRAFAALDFACRFGWWRPPSDQWPRLREFIAAPSARANARTFGALFRRTPHRRRGSPCPHNYRSRRSPRLSLTSDQPS
jgi:hypothetical protein